MKLGIWNIDHPEYGTQSPTKTRRFEEILSYLVGAHCDAFIITEANSALQLPGYCCELSFVSPFKNINRYYGEPNSYHQVAIYCKKPLERIESEEKINGLLCSVKGFNAVDHIYGNVITIKDQWSKESSKKYSDRLSEQIQAIQVLQLNRTVVGGDFNLKRNWSQKEKAYQRIGTELESFGWRWPTKAQTQTVQHVLHSPDLSATFSIDSSVVRKKGTKSGLSDHPFIWVSIDVVE